MHDDRFRALLLRTHAHQAWPRGGYGHGHKRDAMGSQKRLYTSVELMHIVIG